jgi:hypothetical protein
VRARRYYGIDVSPHVAKYAREGAEMLVGDQANRSFWQAFKAAHPEPVDVFIDDGGHSMEQQLVGGWLASRRGVWVSCEQQRTCVSPRSMCVVGKQ